MKPIKSAQESDEQSLDDRLREALENFGLDCIHRHGNTQDNRDKIIAQIKSDVLELVLGALPKYQYDDVRDSIIVSDFYIRDYNAIIKEGFNEALAQASEAIKEALK